MSMAVSSFGCRVVDLDRSDKSCGGLSDSRIAGEAETAELEDCKAEYFLEAVDIIRKAAELRGDSHPGSARCV